MDSQGSLPSPQEPATGPYPVPHKSSPVPHTLLKTHFNVSFPSTPCLPSGLFPSDFPTKILCALLIFHMSRPSHPPWFAHTNNISRRVQIMKFPLCNFLHPPVTSFLLGQNILLSSRIPSMYVLYEWEKKSHNRTKQHIKLCYTFSSSFFQVSDDTIKDSELKDIKCSPEYYITFFCIFYELECTLQKL
jgi:hypothetical protein